jgi:hypothetical protein
MARLSARDFVGWRGGKKKEEGEYISRVGSISG